MGIYNIILIIFAYTDTQISLLGVRLRLRIQLVTATR